MRQYHLFFLYRTGTVSSKHDTCCGYDTFKKLLTLGARISDFELERGVGAQGTVHTTDRLI